jgi:RNA polymerase sigma factor (TIGR02999 family)
LPIIEGSFFHESSPGVCMSSDKLLNSVYDELRRLAAGKLAREAPGQTIDATELVHDAWMRLEKADIQWQDRTHFFRTAATAMRRLLVERARAKLTSKRDAGVRVSLCDLGEPIPEQRVIALDEALEELAEIKPKHAELMELRYFTGMTVDEAAEAMDLSPATADRMVRYAKAWLRVSINRGAVNPSSS